MRVSFQEFVRRYHGSQDVSPRALYQSFCQLHDRGAEVLIMFESQMLGTPYMGQVMVVGAGENFTVKKFVRNALDTAYRPTRGYVQKYYVPVSDLEPPADHDWPEPLPEKVMNGKGRKNKEARAAWWAKCEDSVIAAWGGHSLSPSSELTCLE